MLKRRSTTKEGLMPAAKRGIKSDFEQAVASVRGYLKQETLMPLRGLARFITFGLAGALFFAVGSLFLVLAVIRVLQSETEVFAGAWSFVPYLAGLAASMVMLYLVFTALRKDGKRHGHG